MTQTIYNDNIAEVADFLRIAEESQVRHFFRPHGDEMDATRLYFWQKFFFPNFLKYEDADFHERMDCDLTDLFQLKVQDGELSFLGAREDAKTSKTKLATTYAALYALFQYGIVSSKDKSNSRQFTTDVYNMLTSEKIVYYYGNVFERELLESTKRQQTMSVFTTRTGVRLVAISSLQSARGAVEQEKRPDFAVFDDIENEKTLDSLVETEKIWKYRGELIAGMSQATKKVVNLGNYISESGNIHKIVKAKRGRVRISPIEIDGVIQWSDKYVHTDAEAAEVNKTRPRSRLVVSLESLQKQESYAQEYMCTPRKVGERAFKREYLEKAFSPLPFTETTSGLRVYKKRVRGHVYGIGADTSEGIGKDSQTAVVIDFSVFPFEVVAVYQNDRIDPSDFGLLLCSWGEHYNGATIAVERNNTGHEVLGVLKRKYGAGTIYRMQRFDEEEDVETKKLGWVTTAPSKAKAVGDLRQGLKATGLAIHDQPLVDELFAYTKKDLVATTPLPTRHFDLVMALVIAYQLKDEEDGGLPDFA